METTILNQNYSQICVWEGTLVGEDKIEEFEKFILNETGCRVKYLEEVKTLPGLGGEGGRNDVFMSIHNDDVGKFAVPRLQFGIRWWEDVLGNGNGIIYPDEIKQKYPKNW